jgi:hypothetical protein
MSHNISHLNRVPVNFHTSKVREVLPEHFPTEYPNLVEFLESYYDYMEKDDQGFTYLLNSLYQARDLNTTLLSQLDKIFDEIGLGLNSTDFNINPRLIAKLFANFYREKGSANSAKLFFRGFFDEEVDIVYPKNNMFIVNESRLGPDSLKYIQDDKRYQIHSILIRSGVSLAKWETLFKRFVHPSGFYLAGDIVVEGTVNLGIGDMPISILDSNAGVVSFENTASIASLTFEPLSLIIADDADSDLYSERIDPYKSISDLGGSVTLAQFDDQYNSFIEFQDENSSRFDQDSDGIIVSVDFSNSVETMDQSNFDYLDSTNNTFQYLDLP